MSEAPWKQHAIDAEVVTGEVTETMVEVTASDLVPVEPPESALVTPGQTHFTSSRGDIKDEDIFIPRLRLAQGQTPEVLSREAQPGQWVLLGGEATDECEVVILRMAHVREFRTPGQGDDGGKLLCYSPDYIQGIGDPGIVCSQCALKDWGDVGNSKERQPKCAEIYRYHVYDITHGQLAMLSFQRSSLNVAKTINTFLKQQDFGNFVVKLGSTKQEAGEGRQKFTFYKPTALPRPIDTDTKAAVSMLLG
jgi:hypothetical protein